MKTKPFNLEEYLANPSKKIVTRDGRDVRIICCDAKNSKPIVALVLTRSISQREFDELPVSYFNDGTYYGRATEDFLDLFFADDEEELNEFESSLYTIINNHVKKHENPDETEVKLYSNTLFDIARKKLYEEVVKSVEKYAHDKGYEQGKIDALKALEHCVTISEDDYYKELATQYKKEEKMH